MSFKIGAAEKFDSFVKKCLSNELKYRIRSQKNRSKHVVNFSEMSNSERNQLNYEDKYRSENFIETRMFDAVIQNELLYEALQLLSPDVREIMVLKYWGRYTDDELGVLLNMSRRMVCYNKNRAIALLKCFIEEMMNNDQRFKF